MDKKTLLTLAAGVILGIVFAPQVRKIPGISKLPVV